MAHGWRRWQPWTIAFLGLGLLGVTLLQLATDTGTIGTRLFASAPPVGLSAVTIGFGVWLHTTAFDDAALTRIAGWCTACTIVIGALGTWAFLVMTTAGVPAADASFIVLSAAAFGSVVGDVLGHYDARQHDLRRQAEQAQDALDATSDGIAIFDDRGRMTLVNEALVEMYGFDEREELVGERWEPIVTEETMAAIETRIRPEIRETGSWRGDVTAKRADGSTFPVEMSVATIDDRRTIAVVRDISERRDREEELRYRASLLSAQLEASRDGIVIINEDWEVLEYNDQFREMWGIEEGTLDREGFDLTAAVADRVRNPEAEKERVRAIENAPDAEDRAEIHLEDGRIFDRYSAPVGGDDHYYGRVFTFRDVTQQWRYERGIESLHQASRELTTAESEIDLAETLVAIAEEVLGQPATAFWDYQEDEDVLAPMAIAEGAGKLVDEAGLDGPPPIDDGNVEMEAFRTGVSRIIDRSDVENLAAPEMPLDATLLVPVGEHGLLGVGARGDGEFDQFDRQLVEVLAGNAEAAFNRLARDAELAQSEQHIRTIVENVPIVLFAFDDEEVFTLSEGHGLQGIGLEPGEAVGDTIEEVFELAPELVELCRRALDGASIAETVTFGGCAFEAWLDPVEQDGEIVQVIGTAVDVTERARYESAIESFHNATREMIAAGEAEAICEVTARTARDVLGHSLIGVWLADEGNDRLRPVTATDEAEALLGPQRGYDRGDGLTWKAFESGETLVFDDVREETDVFNSDTPIRSELFTPIGRFGVLTSGAEEPAAFDEKDVALIELLAENAAVAIERTRRQQLLERQTDQMEFFNSILRHDVLNGMTVIRSRAEFLEERLTEEDAEYARTIVAWCDDIVEIIGRVRRVLETLTTEDAPTLEAVNVSGMIDGEIERIAGTYPEVTITTDVPADVRVLADELLSDVLGNVITNAVEHNGAEGLAIDVTVERGSDTVVLRVADNGGGIDEERKEVVFRRDETGHAKSTGSGFGLFFVDSMVDKYGGDVWIEDNDRGGATFVLELPRADHEVAGPPTE